MIMTGHELESVLTSNVGQIYYFCLRKTGDSYEAENLAQDILLCMLEALRRGAAPNHFQAYLWQVARNRYAKWAAQKKRKSQYVCNETFDTIEIADWTEPADLLIQTEASSALRRELAFTAAEYRNLVIAYYLEHRSIKEIAQTQSLPLGTVKSRLFHARNMLREGMQMAREFGQMSYHPENVDFVVNGKCTGVMEEPWIYLKHSLYQNILLAAYRSPSSAEELSIELGVALPYMEDELKFLEAATLLRKDGKKYETNFLIVSASAQKRIHDRLQAEIAAITDAIIAAIEYRSTCLHQRAVKWHEGYQEYEDMKWALLMREVDRVEQLVSNRECSQIGHKVGSFGFTLRPNNGEWDILGRESYPEANSVFVGLHGCVQGTGETVPDFGQFKFSFKEIRQQTPTHLLNLEGKVLQSVALGQEVNEHSEAIQKLKEYGYISKNGDRFVPTFAVFKGDPVQKLLPDETKEYQRLCEAVCSKVEDHLGFCRSVICEEIPAFLANNQYQINFACRNILLLRGPVLEDALKRGYIHYGGGATEAKERMLGAYMFI